MYGEAADYWLQEAREALAELLALKDAEGEPAARARLEVLRQAYLGLRESGEDRPLVELDAGGRIDRQIARTRGAWALWMLRAALGVLDFRELQAAWERGEALTTTALRAWLERGGAAGSRFKVQGSRLPSEPTLNLEPSNLEPAGGGWDTFFDFWIYGTGLPRYELKGATARAAGQGFSVTVQVANRGVGGVPVPVVLQTEEGARHTFPVLAAGGETVEASYNVLTRPVQVAVDPDGELLQPDRAQTWRPVRLRRWWGF